MLAVVALVAVVLRTGIVWRVLALLDQPRGEGVTECRTLTGVGPFWGPRWSPDGAQVAYLEYEKTAESTGDENGGLVTYLEVMSAAGGAAHRVGRFWDAPFEWAKDSQSLLYTFADVRPSPERHGGSLVRVSLRRLSLDSGRDVEVTSASFPLWEGGFWLSNAQEGDLALSPEKRALAFVALTETGEGGQSYQRDLAVLDFLSGRLSLLPRLRDSAGQELNLVGDLTWMGDRIYFTAGHCGRLEIWSVCKDGSGLRQETRGPEDSQPSPRPGGKDLAFIRDGSICLRFADGSVSTLVQAEQGKGRHSFCLGHMSWSPDGSHIVFTWRGKRTPGLSIWVARVVPGGPGE